MADPKDENGGFSFGGAANFFGFNQNPNKPEPGTQSPLTQRAGGPAPAPSPFVWNQTTPHTAPSSLDDFGRQVMGPNLPGPVEVQPRVLTPLENTRLRAYEKAREREQQTFEGTRADAGAGQYLGAIGDFYDQKIKTPFQTNISTPVRQQTQRIEEGADPFMGGTALKAAELATQYAPGLVSKVVPENMMQHLPMAFDVLGGGKSPMHGFGEMTMAQRYDTAMSMGNQFGFGADIQQMQKDLPMNEFRTLLGPGHSTTDASAIQNIMSQTGLDVSDLMGKIPMGAAGRGIASALAPKTMGVMGRLEELQKADTDEGRAAALDEIKAMLGEISADGKTFKVALREEIESLSEHPVFKPFIDGGLEDTGIKMDHIIDMIEPTVDIAQGVLNDHDDQLKEGIKGLKEVAPDAYRAYQERNMDLMMMEGDSSVEFKQKNKVVENIIEQVMALSTGSPDEIKEIVQNQDWDQILKDTPVSEHKGIIAKAAGEIAAGERLSPQSQAGVNRMIGDEMTDSLVSNPLLMGGMFMGGAFGLGALGNMTGGGQGVSGMLPMLAPILMRAALGGDEFDAGIAGVNQSIGKFTDPIFQPMFDMLPKELFDIPIIGGILKDYRDNPLTLATTLTASLTGNDALKDAAIGMSLSNVLFGGTENAQKEAARATAQLSSPASNPSSVPPSSPTAASPTATSTVGDTKRNADMNMVLGEQVHALDIFSGANYRLNQ